VAERRAACARDAAAGDAPPRKEKVADDNRGGEVGRPENHVQRLGDVELEDEVVEVRHGEEEQRHLHVVPQRHHRRAQRQRPAALASSFIFAAAAAAAAAAPHQRLADVARGDKEELQKG
jgi:hypothetical protein